MSSIAVSFIHDSVESWLVAAEGIVLEWYSCGVRVSQSYLSLRNVSSLKNVGNSASFWSMILVIYNTNALQGEICFEALSEEAKTALKLTFPEFATYLNSKDNMDKFAYGPTGVEPIKIEMKTEIESEEGSGEVEKKIKKEEFNLPENSSKTWFE